MIVNLFVMEKSIIPYHKILTKIWFNVNLLSLVTMATDSSMAVDTDKFLLSYC